jgi:2-polyprenyl-6-methoxyphenol hydroxylase-like FAD-dependent oxidoreductase
VPDIVVVGAGLGGLFTALLAEDGHDVMVVERDDDTATGPTTAWDDWPRRGVPQFRQLFCLLPGFRQLAEQGLPAVAAALGRRGAAASSPLHGLVAASQL